MSKYYQIYADGINDYEEYEWEMHETATEKEMFDDVRAALREMGGGHADIFDEETGELFAEIEV